MMYSYNRISYRDENSMVTLHVTWMNLRHDFGKKKPDTKNVCTIIFI